MRLDVVEYTFGRIFIFSFILKLKSITIYYERF